MNRVFKLVSMALIVALLSISFFGCYGNFAATRKVYQFNGNFGNKWGNSVMMYVLSFIQVYSIAAFADVVVFNTVEFWTGSNPMAMAPGEEVIKYAHENGKDLEITIRQNEVIVKNMNTGEDLELSYKPLEKAWYYHSAEGMVKIASLSQDKLALHSPTGKDIVLKPAL